MPRLLTVPNTETSRVFHGVFDWDDGGRDEETGVGVGRPSRTQRTGTYEEEVPPIRTDRPPDTYVFTGRSSSEKKKGEGKSRSDVG